MAGLVVATTDVSLQLRGKEQLIERIVDGREGTGMVVVSRSDEDARRLRAEAEAGWERAKGWFEEELLGADNATQEESKGPSTSQTHAGPD